MSSPNPDFSRPTCRVCLHNNSDQEMSSIFDLDADLGDIFIYEKIEQCAGIEVLRDDCFPTFICDNCYGLLKAAYAFRVTCRNTEEFLKKVLLIEKINAPLEKDLEQNPLAVNEDTNIHKRKARSKTKQLVKINSSQSPEVIKTELTTCCSELTESPTNFEEPIADNCADNDDNVLCFDDANYCNDDENNKPRKRNTKVAEKKIKLDMDEEQISRTKIKQKTKNANEKTKRSTIKKTRSKILTLSKNDNKDKRSKKVLPAKKEKKEKRLHICEICGNKFPHRYTLKNHIKRHLNEKSFNCEICGYSSHSNMELVRHLRTHTGSKPFKCQYCNRAFGDNSTLIKHERVHRNERPFKCEICGSSFSYPAVLKRHNLVHTGEKPYKCEICGKCFNDRYHLQSHLKTIQHQNDPRVESLLKNIRENNVKLDI